MHTVQKTIRVMRINFILMRHNLGEIVTQIHIFRPLRFFTYLNPYHWMPNKKPRGERLRLALQELGPIFVKFGQMLSTRRDILPDDIAKELSKLQDEVAPFPGAYAQAIIEHALEQPIDKIFKQFDLVPIASASVAQVHAATLFSGEEVVVKVLRPNIEKIIRSDIELLYFVAHLAQRYSHAGRRLKAVQVISEFEKTLLDELDLTREAANASQLRRNHLNDTQVHIPKVYWDYTKNNILVLERIHGISLRRLDAIAQANVSMTWLAKTILYIFFQDLFEHSFFHADMHAGNLMVNVDSPNHPCVMMVDFGIVGTLSRSDQEYLAQNLFAFLSRDYRRVAQLHIESGWVPLQTREDEFESAIRSVSEPIFERPLKDVSLGEMLLRLIQVARRFHMEVLPQLILLQKTLLNIEGMCRQIDPDLDIWDTLQPLLEQWMAQRVGPVATVRELSSRFPQISAQMLDIPEMIFQSLKRNQGMHIERIREKELREELPKHSLGITLFGATVVNLALFGALLWFYPEIKNTFVGMMLGLGASCMLSSLLVAVRRG